MNLENATPEHHGRRRPPSVFDALMSLSPPSPILNAYFPATCSTEEVPVLLFDPSSSDLDLMDASENSSRATEFRANTQSLGIPCSNSTDTIGTIGTVGTFGQFRRRSSAPRSQRSSVFSCSEINADLAGTDTIDLCPDKASREKHFQTNGKPPQPYERRATQENDVSNINERGIAPALSSESSLSPPSPSPSVYSTLSCSSPHSRLRSQAPLGTRPVSYSDSAGVLHSSTSALESCIPARRTPIFDQSAGAEISSSPSLAVSDHNDMSALFSKELPKSLHWLRDTVVEMLIDQEGFRSVAPKFRFAGYSSTSRYLGNGLPREVPGGIAEFVPISRQTFNFHYAPFEGQPILRRLTINGEARDYISRQATLSIKSNGVYTVNGSETSTFHTPQEKRTSRNQKVEDTKLFWKLDYFVDNKRGSRVMEGEKNFTPLVFCCSPLLFHPLQGKKIRLIQVVKKSVVMKLVAERMELPPLLSSPRLLPTVSNPSPHRTKQFEKTYVDDAAVHYKTDSHSNHSHMPFAQMLINDNFKPSRFRRRRASSGGEASSRFETQGQTKPRPVSTDGLKQYRHILPPSKLSEMLDNMENAAPIDNMHTLTPPPRSVRKRI